jgi:hypothetical protein
MVMMTENELDGGFFTFQSAIIAVAVPVAVIFNVGHEGRARSEVKYASHSMPLLGYFTGEDLLTS